MMSPAKGDSFEFINKEKFTESKFYWQEGYGAFSIGKSQVDATVAYIRNQAEHHRKQTFQAEFLAFLEKHEIDYDPQFLWG